MEEKIKLHDLPEKEQEQRKQEIKNKAIKITKRVLLAFFCCALILFMVFSLIAGIFDSNNEDDSSHDHNHAHAIVEIIK